MTAPARSSRDPIRSLFGIAVGLWIAALLLREIHEVRLYTGPQSFIMLAAWVAAVISVVASLLEVARDYRLRSLYFAVALAAGHVLAFPTMMDGSVRTLIAGLVWVLLGAVVLVEGHSLLRQSPPTGDEDDD